MGFSILCQYGLGIVPSVSLVKNIGFNDRATHTKQDAVGFRSQIVNNEINFPLVDPGCFVMPNHDYELTLLKQLQRERRLQKWLYIASLPSKTPRYILRRLRSIIRRVQA